MLPSFLAPSTTISPQLLTSNCFHSFFHLQPRETSSYQTFGPGYHQTLFPVTTKLATPIAPTRPSTSSSIATRDGPEFRMPVTEFAVLPFRGSFEYSSPPSSPPPDIAEPPRIQAPSSNLGRLKKSVKRKLGFFFCLAPPFPSLPLPIEPATPIPPLTVPDYILTKLQTAHEVLERVSGHRFRFFQQVEDPSIVYIVGKWDSTEAHTAFIESPENQRLLELFGDDVQTEGSRSMEMCHLDTDIFDYPDSDDSWLLSAPFVGFQWYSCSTECRAQADEGLGRIITNMRDIRRAAGGWKIEKEEGMENFLVFFDVEYNVAELPAHDGRQRAMIQATLELIFETERHEMVPIEGL